MVDSLSYFSFQSVISRLWDGQSWILALSGPWANIFLDDGDPSNFGAPGLQPICKSNLWDGAYVVEAAGFLSFVF